MQRVPPREEPSRRALVVHEAIRKVRDGEIFFSPSSRSVAAEGFSWIVGCGLAFGCLLFGTANGVNEGRGSGRRWNFSVKNTLDGNARAVDGAHRVVVAANVGAIQGDACKDAFGARVSQNLSIEFPIGISGGVAAD